MAISVPPSVRSNWVLLLGVLCLVLLCSQRHSGFVILLAAPVVLAYQLFLLFRRRQQALERARRLVAIGAVLAGMCLVLAIHFRIHQTTRAAADEVAQKIERFAAEAGRYPVELKPLGFDAAQLRGDLMLNYHLFEGQPSLFYAATFVPFDTWHYDFTKHDWTYAPG